MHDHEIDPATTDDSNATTNDGESVDKLNELETENAPDANDTVTSVEDEEEYTKEESRVRQALRKLIRWTVGLLIVFGFGYLAAVFTIYNPKVDELNRSQDNLDNVEATITELQSEISTQQEELANLNAQIEILNTEISNLEKEKTDLYATQSQTQDEHSLHIALLKARIDIISALVELYEGNPAQARVLINSASENLPKIESLLSNDWEKAIPLLQNSLEFSIEAIDVDPETAINYLIIVTGDLLQIENANFDK